MAASKSLTLSTPTDLWAAFAGHDQVWTYIAADGPFATAAEFVPCIAETRGGG